MTLHRSVRASHHAVVRFLERIKGVDVAAVRNRIDFVVTDEMLLAYMEHDGVDVAGARREIEAITGSPAFLGAAVVAHDGHCIVIENYTVKTVLPKGGRPRKQSRPRGRYLIAPRSAG